MTLPRSIGTVLLVFVVIGFAATAAMGQVTPEGELALPRIVDDEMKDPPIILGYIMLALLLAIGVGVNMIPSKRGHQD